MLSFFSFSHLSSTKKIFTRCCWKMATWAAVFVMLGVTMATTKVMGFKRRLGLPDDIQFDMAPNSVDDMYDGCRDKMLEKVKKEFLPQEKINKDFNRTWNEAEKYYDKKWSPHNGKNPFSHLTKEQIMAIYAYTCDEVYLKFNTAVRTGKNNYKTTFMYHTLHFFLTDAIQFLNSPRSKSCVTTYRGVNIAFKKKKNILVFKSKFRFGSFTSSSMNKTVALEFGNITCFKIYTCFGANITQYSSIKEESEVLIPPYEVFEVSKVEKRTKRNKLPCDLFYTVKSTKKVQSTLNCALFRTEQPPLCSKMCNNTHNFHNNGWI
ncbi:erythroblast NAD(P)(+)--arginine ADP-ribosyltransferase-like [Cololabis saira]|uniref:erythroblast NAD(P)(+)--arginine ADP-ribosyltransferase-like n=1 Tax=Cololabis saira TaxID=129043 RepID=UPI002AD4276B|nr:erythroblast NAD(P)(+)--arginine ADP-ribosyltransferase-like [Cololabis saira]